MTSPDSTTPPRRDLHTVDMDVPEAAEFTDAGLADLIAREVMHRRYIHVTGLDWHRWDGARWVRCQDAAPTEAIRRYVLRQVRIAGRRLDAVPDDGDAAQRVKNWRAVCSARRIGAILKLTIGHPLVGIEDASRLDADPYLLNTANGTLDLRSLTIRDADPDDLITRKTTARFTATPRCPLWTAFLDRVLPDRDVRDYLQRLAGIALFGAVYEHLLPILTGTGANGKGTFYGALMRALGDYAGPAEPDLFLVHPGAHPVGQMDLFGRRLVVISEIDEHRHIAEATVKRLTGGDRIKARNLYGPFIEFDPSHTAMMVTNHLPKVRGDDPAIWRRIRVIPFAVNIPEHEWIADLGERLTAEESDGILAWALDGWIDYRDNGLHTPAAVKASTEDYRKANDDISRFVDERCTTTSPAQKVSATDLYTAWERWATANGATAIAPTVFGKEIGRRGWPAKPSNGRRWHTGIGLIPDTTPTP